MASANQISVVDRTAEAKRRCRNSMPRSETSDIYAVRRDQPIFVPRCNGDATGDICMEMAIRCQCEDFICLPSGRIAGAFKGFARGLRTQANAPTGLILTNQHRHGGCTRCDMPHRQSSIAQIVETAAGGRAVMWEEMTWPQIAAMRDDGMDFCLLPAGATEQHGPHLPVNTDSVFANSVCRYASAKTGVPVLPTLTIGCSLGHTDHWPGTLSLYPETFSSNVREIAGFLIRTGFKRLLIVNSHWGNTSSLRCAIDRLRFDHAGRFQIGLKNSFEFTRGIWAQFIDDGEDFHANRAETALMEFLDPAAVRKEKIQDDPDRTAGKVFTYVVPQTSTNGLTGHPSRATAEDGRRLFLEMGEALTAFVTAARTEKAPLDWSR